LAANGPGSVPIATWIISTSVLASMPFSFNIKPVVASLSKARAWQGSLRSACRHGFGEPLVSLSPERTKIQSAAENCPNESWTIPALQPFASVEYRDAAGRRSNLFQTKRCEGVFVSILFAQGQLAQHLLLTARGYANIFRSVLSQTSKFVSRNVQSNTQPGWLHQGVTR
jgi:hypothetical protein